LLYTPENVCVITIKETLRATKFIKEKLELAAFIFWETEQIEF